MAKSHILGFPRIGAQRELKFALESYWRGDSNREQLLDVAATLRQRHWQLQKQAGLSFVSVGDFSLYDQVLDHSFMFGVVPPRFKSNAGDTFDNYFRCARGRAPSGADVHACEMTKWFDTNYHYIVPEFEPEQTFSLHAEQLINQILEAKSLGHQVKPVILGPLSYLYLGKCQNGGERLDLLPRLLPIYQQLISQLQALGIEWLQIDEPILVLDLNAVWQQAFIAAYKNLQSYQVRLLLTSYFGALQNNFAIVQQLAVDGLHIDAVRAADEVEHIVEHWPATRVLSLGVVDGRSIWRNDLTKSLKLLQTAEKKFSDKLWISGSCSLLHVPNDLDLETTLDSEIRSWLAFGRQKLQELAVLAKGINDGEHSISAALQANDAILDRYRGSARVNNQAVQQRIAKIAVHDATRHSAYAVRAAVQRQQLNLPLLPTTTIGSFPQTAEIRQLRASYKRQAIDAAAYETGIKQQIAEHIAQQEALELDVLVHGESERNDMVEYFGEQLQGFTFSSNGWVQSYGSRCVKPPIIYGDVSRPQAMTVKWTTYAQSLTAKPVKGMLTGPNTILGWSFARTDISRQLQAQQIALALRDEVADLEAAGIQIIQIDEPAFREGLPLREAQQTAYLNWAIEAFKLSSCVVADQTQIHTHMCYSDFNAIIEAIAALDADVITIETSRSDMKLLNAFETFAYPNEIGPGVYDIHSPVVPSETEMRQLLKSAAQRIPVQRLWVNPDCGLKTRAWPEVKAALTEMVAAAKNLRLELA